MANPITSQTKKRTHVSTGSDIHAQLVPCSCREIPHSDRSIDGPSREFRSTWIKREAAEIFCVSRQLLDLSSTQPPDEDLWCRVGSRAVLKANQSANSNGNTHVVRTKSEGAHRQHITFDGLLLYDRAIAETHYTDFCRGKMIIGGLCRGNRQQGPV